MHIAVISTPFVSVPPCGYGGTELVVAALVDALAACGHAVTLFATGDSHVQGRVRWRHPTGLWPPDFYRELAHAAWAVGELRRRTDVDLVHAHIPSVLPLREWLPAPLVYTLHHTLDPSVGELYDVCAGDALVVAISERQRALQPRADRVVHHGLLPEQYPLGRGSGGHAAFVGRFAQDKGAHVAIDVARAASVPIRLAGRLHEQDARYYEEVLESRLSLDGVTCVGEVTHEPKLRLLGEALVTLFPIDWEEPFGLVMIESMLCGTPVLAFARGSTPEVVDEGVTGWVVDQQGMVERLARLARGEPFDRERCRRHAARRFSAARMARDYLDIYRALGGEA